MCACSLVPRPSRFLVHIKYFAYNVCVRAGRSGNEAMCVCVFTCACTCMCVCVCMCVRVCGEGEHINRGHAGCFMKEELKRGVKGKKEKCV